MRWERVISLWVRCLFASVLAGVRARVALALLPINCRPHQGLILDASPLVWRELDVLPDATSMQQQQESEQPNSTDSSNSSSTGGLRHPVWLALDEVMDPVCVTWADGFTTQLAAVVIKWVKHCVRAAVAPLPVGLTSPCCAHAIVFAAMASLRCTAASALTAKPWSHAALRLLPGGVWRAGLLPQLCAAVTCCQQGISGGDGAHDTAQLQVSSSSGLS